MNAETKTLVSQATRRISCARIASRRPASLCPRARPQGLGALAPVALQLGEALDLHLAAQGVADDLAAGLAQALGKGVGLFGEIVRQGDGKKAAHMKTSYPSPDEQTARAGRNGRTPPCTANGVRKIMFVERHTISVVCGTDWLPSGGAATDALSAPVASLASTFPAGRTG